MIDGFIKFLTNQGNIYLVIIAFLSFVIFYGMRYYFNKQKKDIKNKNLMDDISNNINNSMNNLSEEVILNSIKNENGWSDIKINLNNLDTNLEKLWDAYNYKMNELEINNKVRTDKIVDSYILISEVKDEIKDLKYKVELLIVQIDHNNNNTTINKGL